MPNGSYSVSYIQDYFENILEKHETVNGNPSISIYLNKTENIIIFETKAGYYLKLLTPETMKLLRSSNN